MVDTTVFAPVIGLEVHAQVLTRSKMFCGCSADYSGSPANTHVCTVCGGMPGALPVINRRAVESAVLTARALHCTVDARSKFDRKNYSYPDLPKGYQITQYDLPIGHDGWLEFESGSDLLRCGIIRVHLEEDTGKSIHGGGENEAGSLIDYNRSGVPLMEIVSAPDLASPLAARQYFATLRQVLMYLGVCDGNLQEGSMRADVNVSVRAQDGTAGTKVEIKNLNSFRAVERALDFEIARQRAVLADGELVIQETRGWSEAGEATVPQRTKEQAQDYRYFPEPDLPPLVFPPAYVEEIETRMPEMPHQRRERLIHEYQLAAATAALLTDDPSLATFFETAVRAAPAASARTIGHWLTGDVMRLRAESGTSIEASALTPFALARLVEMVEAGVISAIAAKDVLPVLYREGGDPDEIAERLDLLQLSDESALAGLVDTVLADNARLVDLYRAGKTSVLQALVGGVRQASGGKADPVRTAQLVAERLKGEEAG